MSRGKLCPVPSKPHEVHCCRTQVLAGGCSPSVAAWAELQAPVRSCRRVPSCQAHTSPDWSLCRGGWLFLGMETTFLPGISLRHCFSAKTDMVYKPGTGVVGVLPPQQSSPLPQICVASSLTHQLRLFTVSVTHLPFTTHDFDRDLGCYLWAFSSALI